MEDSQAVTIAAEVSSGSASAPLGLGPSDGWRADLDPANRYEHRREIGRGGMGEVALAFDRGIDRPVALKRLSGSAPDEVARFVDEARIVGRMEHPNVVPVHDIGIDRDGRLFFVMKYVEGDSLRQIIDRLGAGDADYHRRYPFERRMDIFQGLLRALQYAHGLGILHRDVKPENVVIGPYGEVVLMDWGIARSIEGQATEPSMRSGGALHRVSGQTEEGACIGTPAYMSPEQALGGGTELDGRSDLYSAFVVLYEMLTLTHYVGRKARSIHQILLEVHERELPALDDPAFRRADQPAVPIEMRHFLRRGLQRAREERFPTAQAVLDALQDLRSGDIAVQCPFTFAKRMGYRYMRLLDAHPFAGLGVVVAPLLALIVTLVVLLATR